MASGAGRVDEPITVWGAGKESSDDEWGLLKEEELP
jgi:hypothetical protein